MALLELPPVRDVAALALSAASDLARPPRREFATLPVPTTSVTVATRHGEVRCTVYRSESAPARPPVHVNLHGGGFVIRYPEQDDPWCRYLATHAGAVVLNVEYATAPRARFPVALEQALDVVRWAGEEARPWDGTRLTVGGQSAGGSLAAGVARLALEQGGPPLALQVLHYPVLDLATPARVKPHPSGRRSVPPLWMSVLFAEAYLPDPTRRTDRLASPAWGRNAEGLAGIAPAVVVTGEHDRLRDEGAAYAQALDAVGALVAHVEVPGVTHGYDILEESPEATRRTYAQLAQHVVDASAT